MPLHLCRHPDLHSYKSEPQHHINQLQFFLQLLETLLYLLKLPLVALSVLVLRLLEHLELLLHSSRRLGALPRGGREPRGGPHGGLARDGLLRNEGGGAHGGRNERHDGAQRTAREHSTQCDVLGGGIRHVRLRDDHHESRRRERRDALARGTHG